MKAVMLMQQLPLMKQMQINVRLYSKENLNYFQTNDIQLDFEYYLKGVVPAEIGNAHIEACKAQAVAARTFALCKSSKSGQITDMPSVDQCFRVGRISSSYANAQLAVEETAGQVLYYNDKLINNAYYSNSNGGRIKSSYEVWGGSRPYLISKDDPYDKGPGNGHGVGLSQVGAKQMAALGFNYKQILEFYYPGTVIKDNYGEERVISVATKVEKVKEYAISKIGCGYVWGATGQIATESELKRLENKFPKYVDYNVVKKWLGKQIFDCASFVARCMNQANIAMATGASSAWENTKWMSRGEISSLPVDKVCCLYRQTSKDVMQHTGIYLGNGTFIDARGSVVGVIGPNEMSSYKWTHWGIPVGLYDDSQNVEVIKVAYQATVTKIAGASGSTVNMRKEPSSGAGVITTIKFGQTVDVTGTTGEWSAITWNGKSGYMQSKFLTKVNDTEDKVWYVRVRCDSEAQAKAVANLLKQAETST